MLVGVVSDSHDNRANVAKAAKVLRKAGVEVLIHLGDVVAPFTLRDFLDLVKPKKFYLVYGNNDGEKLGLAKVASSVEGRVSDQPLIIELGGRRIMALHGFGDSETTVELVDALARSRKWHVIMYGHTHSGELRYLRGVLVLNPGDLSGQLAKPSIALLDTRTLRARLVSLEG